MRLFLNEAMENNEVDYELLLIKRTKAEELDDIIFKHSGIDSTSIQTQNILTCIKKGMMFFEAIKECPKPLKRLKNCLDTFSSSLVEAERCFSAAGLLITKLRSSLSGYKIDLLCFMRSDLKQ